MNETELNISCDYYHFEDFNKHDLALLRMNIFSLPAHIDDLKRFLNLLDINFDITCFSESRLSTKASLTTNIHILSYNIEQAPTGSSAGGTLSYVSKTFLYKLKSDLNIYSTQELESTFVEIPSKQNLITGTIYKHVPMKPSKFNNKFLEPLSKPKNLNTILAGNVNLNLLSYNKKARNSSFPKSNFHK